MTPVLQASGLVRRFGHVTALDHCDFELLPGEIMAVIGDNGAGKSSLIKCLSGADTPDEGVLPLPLPFVRADVEDRRVINHVRCGQRSLVVNVGERPRVRVATVGL